MEAAALGDLGPDLGVELLGRQRLGVLGGVGARLAVGLGLLVGGQLLEQVFDLGSQAVVERVAGGGDLGQEGTRPAVVAGTQGRQGRLVEAERPALLGERDLGDQLVGLGLDAELAGLGLGRELLGCLVVAVLVQFLGLAEQELAAIGRLRRQRSVAGGSGSGGRRRPRAAGCAAPTVTGSVRASIGRRPAAARRPGCPSARPGRVPGWDPWPRFCWTAGSDARFGRDRRPLTAASDSPVRNRSASENLAAAASWSPLAKSSLASRSIFTTGRAPLPARDAIAAGAFCARAIAISWRTDSARSAVNGGTTFIRWACRALASASSSLPTEMSWRDSCTRMS